MLGAHRLEPHGLPDAARGGVVDADGGLVHLLADRLAGGADRVDIPDDELVAPGCSRRRDVERERVVVAAVRPARRPLTYTRVDQLTAPKFSSTRCPRQLRGTLNVRRYQPAVSSRSIPDSGDWTGNGTRIVCARLRPNGGRCPGRARSYCHWPFRFSQRRARAAGAGTRAAAQRTTPPSSTASAAAAACRVVGGAARCASGRRARAAALAPPAIASIAHESDSPRDAPARAQLRLAAVVGTADRRRHRPWDLPPIASSSRRFRARIVANRASARAQLARCRACSAGAPSGDVGEASRSAPTSDTGTMKTPISAISGLPFRSRSGTAARRAATGSSSDPRRGRVEASNGAKPSTTRLRDQRRHHDRVDRRAAPASPSRRPRGAPTARTRRASARRRSRTAPRGSRAHGLPGSTANRRKPDEQDQHDPPHEVVDVQAALGRDAARPPRDLRAAHQPRARADEQEREQERGQQDEAVSLRA